MGWFSRLMSSSFFLLQKTRFRWRIRLLAAASSPLEAVPLHGVAHQQVTETKNQPRHCEAQRSKPAPCCRRTSLPQAGALLDGPGSAAGARHVYAFDSRDCFRKGKTTLVKGVIFSLLISRSAFFFPGLANYFRNWKKKGVSAEPLIPARNSRHDSNVTRHKRWRTAVAC